MILQTGDVVRIVTGGDGVDATIGLTGKVLTAVPGRNVAVRLTHRDRYVDYNYQPGHLEIELDPDRLTKASEIPIPM